MTTCKVDFSHLSLKDALDLAILIEDEAKERYEEFTHQLTTHRTLDAAGFFRFMADNEGRHGDGLRQRRRQMFGDAAREVTAAQLLDVEAPEYDEARAFMTARQALEVALRCEQKAHAFFVAALEHMRGRRVRALFQELRDEEVHHQDLVRRELARLPPESGVNGEAFVDEPVAQ